MQHSKSMAATSSSSPQHFLKLSPHRYVSHCCHGNNSSCIEVMQQAGLPLKFGAQHSMHRVKHTLEVQNAQRRRAATWTPTQSSVSKCSTPTRGHAPIQNSNSERYSNWYSKSRWKKKTHKSTTTWEELHTDPKTDRQNFRYTLDVSSKTVRKTRHRDRCEMEGYKVGWKKVLKDTPKSLAYTVRPFFPPKKTKQAIK